MVGKDEIAQCEVAPAAIHATAAALPCLEAAKLAFTCSQFTTFQKAATYSGRLFWYFR